MSTRDNYIGTSIPNASSILCPKKVHQNSGEF